MGNGIDLIVTDFGEVRLTPKTTAYLDSVAEDWRKVVATRPRKNEGRRRRYVRQKVREVESAAMTLAAIEFITGGVLESL